MVHKSTYKELQLETGERLSHRVSYWIAQIQLNSVTQTSLIGIVACIDVVEIIAKKFRTIGNTCYNNYISFYPVQSLL